MKETYRWRYMGYLKNPKEISAGGVYLLVYCGKPKRIVYVGTTNSFNRRIKQHQEGMLRGNRTVWRLSNDSDIYELISCSGEKNSYKYYYSLAKKGLLWASTTVEKEVVRNELKRSDDFINNWKDYVQDSYIGNIEIWVCKMNANAEKMVYLESQIQRTLKSNYSIGSHIHNEGMCWLGKIEFTGHIFNEKFKFDNYPEISEEYSLLLSNLSDLNYLNYGKPKHIILQEQKEKSKSLLREKYKFAMTSWCQKENDILFTCLHLGIPINQIASIYLQRSTEEIVKRIKYLSTYYNFPKYKLE